ncbi:MAG: hypothetical protein ACYTGL_04020 [Planctomycetota bacterium]|jgi:hypothetical protein
MPHPAVDKFGKIVVNKLRDAAIDDFDRLTERGYNAPALQPLQDELAAMSPNQLAAIRRAVISAVDNGMHDFLFAVGEYHDCDKSIQIIVDGHDVADSSDGLNA